MLLRTTPVSSPNPKALVVVSKSVRAVKFCTNKILHNGRKTVVVVVVVVVMLFASIVKSIKRQSDDCLSVCPVVTVASAHSFAVGKTKPVLL